jgi:hypothetical protein
MLVQRIGIDKRGATDPAEKFKLKGLRRMKAGGADGNAREGGEGFFAETAVIRENAIKHERGYGFRRRNQMRPEAQR